MATFWITNSDKERFRLPYVALDAAPFLQILVNTRRKLAGPGTAPVEAGSASLELGEFARQPIQLQAHTLFGPAAGRIVLRFLQLLTSGSALPAALEQDLRQNVGEVAAAASYYQFKALRESCFDLIKELLWQSWDNRTSIAEEKMAQVGYKLRQPKTLLPFLGHIRHLHAEIWEKDGDMDVGNCVFARYLLLTHQLDDPEFIQFRAVYGQAVYHTCRIWFPSKVELQYQRNLWATSDILRNPPTWHLHQAGFRAWKSGPLVITMPQGCGKTILASVLAHRAREAFSQDTGMVGMACRYYFTPDRPSIRYCLYAIIHQLCQMGRACHLDDYAVQFFAHSGLDTYDLEIFWAIFRDIAESDRYHHLTIVLDGLEHVEAEPRLRMINTLATIRRNRRVCQPRGRTRFILTASTNDLTRETRRAFGQCTHITSQVGWNG